MKHILIAVAALLTSVTVSGSELEGKAIICKTQLGDHISDYMSPVTGTLYRGFMFVEGKKVVEYIVRKSAVGMEVGHLDGLGEIMQEDYREDVHEVRWDEHSLDRRTLELTLTYTGRDNYNYNPSRAISATFPCDLYADERTYENALEEYARQEAEFINAAMKDNKI